MPKSAPHARMSRGFMGQTWDGGDLAFQPELWAEVLRVLKPGAHLVAFGGTRTYHRMACAIEDAGFEIRDQIGWTYGSGFPKSADVSKMIDKAAGAERYYLGEGPYAARKPRPYQGGTALNISVSDTRVGHPITAPATAEAAQWDGWGTALKPAWEPICLARKPLSEKTVAANVLKWGTGALNINGCRIGVSDADTRDVGRQITRNVRDADGWGMNSANAQSGVTVINPDGRWPANLIHDGSDEVLALFPDSKGQQGDVRGTEPSLPTDQIYGQFKRRVASPARNDSGSAARFFYCAKASKKDRGEGNVHPTVKPTDLMRYLCRLVTPSRGIVLDPFTGSGSTGLGALLCDFDFIGIEKDDGYANIADRRLSALSDELGLNYI
jgi:site-specific DNA-methyltransferase (adenine-specific)